MHSALCVGELLIDFMGKDLDKSIKEQESFVKKAGGAPANVASTIAALGGHSYFGGAVGREGFGSFLTETLMHFNVDLGALKVSHLPTTLAFVSVESDGNRDFIFNRGADADYSFDDIPKSILEESRIYHFGGATAFLEGTLSQCYQELLQYAIDHNKFIVFDPNYRSAFWQGEESAFINHVKPFIKAAGLVKLSDEEALIITGTQSVEEAISALKMQYDTHFVMTLGKDGAVLFSRQIHVHVLAPTVKVIDTTGAGDAFIGAFIKQLLGFDRPETILSDPLQCERVMRESNRIAGEVCTAFGALSAIEVLMKES